MRVLVFINYYLPAYKAGGPLKSIQGLCDYLGKEVEFYIVTQNRDVGDKEPFPNIETGCWTKKLENCNVFYIDRMARTTISKVLQDKEWDLLYLQSFFDPQFTLKPLLWWKVGLLKARQVLVATRGEFSPGAIQLKSAKKRSFLKLARWFSLYRGVFWQASSEREKKDILREIPQLASPDRIFTATDIPPKIVPLTPSENDQSDNKERLRVLYLSRISKMKNLDFALQVLSKITIPIEFNIFGPNDKDPEYWQTCNQLLKSLPPNIHAKYHGSVPPHQVPGKFASHDVFFLPTRGENFGHVVFESLQCGCSVLLSDQTPWQDLKQKNVGWVIPLNNNEAFNEALTELNDESTSQRDQRRKACLEYAEQFLLNSNVIKQNRQMFQDLQQLSP